MTELSLHSRSGLPDALRVLLADFPKEKWQQDPRFGGTVQFWLERHLMFRRVLDLLIKTTQSMADRKVSTSIFCKEVSRYGGMFVNGLHEHHTIEDTYYFPKLMTLDTRISSGFDILERDHHDIDALLNAFVDTANPILQKRDDDAFIASAAPQFEAQLQTLRHFLDRHLTDEEELIVPVILRYGDPSEG